MIISLNVETENTYYKIFETIKYEFSKLDSVKTKKGDLANIPPDYSTLSLRLNKIEKFIYYGIYAMLIESINPNTRICAIDGTALKSSKFDGDARH